MNVKKDDYGGLLYQISTAADRNFTETQTLSLIDIMQTLGWKGSYRITALIVRTNSLPRNIYGYVLSLLEEEIDRIRKAFLEKEEWKPATQDCASPEEFQLTMRCIGLITQLKKPGMLLERFSEYMQEAIARGKLLDTLERAEEFYEDLLRKEREKSVPVPAEHADA